MMHSHIRWFHSYQWPNKTIYFTWRGSPHGAAMLWRKWSEVMTFRPSMVTHTRNLCSAINPSKVRTHSSEHTHTVNTHPEQLAAIYAAEPGSSWGFGALLKGTSVVVLKVERALDIHSPHLQSLPTWDLNSQPLDYESDSLTIRSRLPHLWSHDQLNYCLL